MRTTQLTRSIPFDMDGTNHNITLHFTWDGDILTLDDVTGESLAAVNAISDDTIESERREYQRELLHDIAKTL